MRFVDLTGRRFGRLLVVIVGPGAPQRDIFRRFLVLGPQFALAKNV